MQKFYPGICGSQLFNDLLAAIRRTVVHYDNLVRRKALRRNRSDGAGDAFALVVERNNDRYFVCRTLHIANVMIFY